MKFTRFLRSMLFILLFMSTVHLHAQPKIIFDTDLGGDADDLGALAMLHHYVDWGECDLLAVMCWSGEQYAIPAIDAVNRYYGHPDIPLGVRKEGTFKTDWHYTRPLAQYFPHLHSFWDVPDATQLYRKILAGQPDNSVVIVTVGPLKNIQNLIQSQPDGHSDLHGIDLISKKVKQFVIMGGKFPEGEDEWNFDGDMRGVTRFVVDHISVPVVFSGYEIGVQIKTGKKFNELDTGHPLYVGYKHFSEHAPWMKEYYKGEILDNASYDQTAVLYAVKGRVGEFWEEVKGGYCEVEPDGDNHWVEGEETNESYLKLTAPPEEVAKEIEAVMLGKKWE